MGMEEGVFPHSRSLFEDNEMEEERRLAYVGITRAEQELYLLNAQMRTLFGKTNVNPKSRFIGEIPSELVESLNETMRKPAAGRSGASASPFAARRQAAVAKRSLYQRAVNRLDGALEIRPSIKMGNWYSCKCKRRRRLKRIRHCFS